MQKFLRTLTLMAFLVVPWVTQAQVSLPYSYGFEDNDLSADGWLLQNASSTSTTISSSAVQTGSYGFMFYYSEQNNASLVSPLLTGGDNGVIVTFSYKSYSGNYPESFQVGYTTDATVTDAANFTYPGGDCNVSDAPTVWNQFEYTFPAGTKRIAVKYVYTDAYYLCLDDFYFEALSSCPNPVGLAVSEIGPNSAKLAWTERGTATSWRICLNGDETNLITANTNPFTLTGLTAETPYTVKVRAYCSSSDQSIWSTEESFTTTSSCPVPYDLAASNVAAHTATLGWTGFSDSYNVRYRQKAGFFDDFESGLTNWTIYTVGDADAAWAVTDAGTSAHSGSSVAYAASYGNSSYNADNWLVTPQVPLGGTLRFWEKAYSSSYRDQFEVVLSTTGNTVADFQNGTVLRAMGQSSVDWNEVVIDLSSYSGQGYIAIHHQDYDMWALFIDDFSLEYPSAEPWTTVTATTTSLALSGLAASTLYEYQVQGVCGSTTTDWSELADFTTAIACPAVAFSSIQIASLTAHECTFTWTAGGEETSWLFTVNDETPVSVTGTPTYTMQNLAGETRYDISIQADCGLEDGVSVAVTGYFTTPVACPAPTALTASNPTTSSVELSWTNGDEETAWQICLNGDEENPIAVTSNPYTLTGLNDNTTYTVKVRANCGGVDGVSQWSNEETFTTIANCVAPTDATASNITAHTADLTWMGTASSYNVRYQVSSDVTEGFESGSMPEGWTSEGNSTWSVSTGDYSSATGAHSGSYNAKITHSTSGNTTYLVMPAMDLSAATEASLNLWYVNRSWAGDIDGFGVYYRVNGGSWNELFSTTEAHATWTELNINLTGLDANYQIGFKMTDSYGYGVAIDDIEVVVPNDTWTTDVATTNSYSISGLDGETTYKAQVQTVCGGSQSVWSDAVSFTTDIACPATTALTVGEVTTSTVELSWTENGSATAWQLCINGDEENLIAANSNPFTLTGLAEFTGYTVKVRANCGGIDGVSQWSNEADFQTLAGCQAVQNLVVTANLAHEVSIAWTDPNAGSTTYTVTKNGEIVTSTWSEPNYTFTNLTAQTDYTFTVTVNCGSDVSVVDSVSVTTACEAISTFPVTYGFESEEGFTGSTAAQTTNTIGQCWRNIATVGTGSNLSRVWCIYTSTSVSYVHNGTQSLKLQDKGSSSAGVSKTLLVFPPMNFTAANGYIVSFWIRRDATTSNPEGFMVYASNTDTIDANAVYLGHYSRNYGMALPQVESASGWYQYETEPITLTGNVYLIFEGQSYYGNATYVDDVEIKVAPTCIKVSNLAINADQTTDNSLTLTWTDSYNTGASYTIYNMEDNTVVASGVTATTYTATGLTANTAYTFGVEVNCAVDDASEIATVSGRTECAAMNLPWTCGFEADELMTTTNSEANPALPWCSYRYFTPSATSGRIYPYSYASNPNTGSRALYYYGTTSTSYPEVMAFILPQVNVASFPMNNNRVTFYAKMGTATSKMVKAYTLTDPTDWSTAIEVPEASVTVSGTTYEKYSINLTNAEAAAAYVALAVERGTGALYMDDLTLEVMPACLEVTDLAVTEATASSISFAWTDDVNPTATYSIYNVTDDGDVLVESNVAATNYTVSGLNANTAYNFAVQATCPLGNAALTTVSTRTACATIADLTEPITWTFEDSELQGTTNALRIPWCWTRFNNASSTSYNYYPYANSSTTYAHGGSRYLYFYASTGASYAATQIAVMPQIDINALPLNTLRLRFFARGGASYGGTLSVGTMNDPTNAETFTEVQSFELTSGTAYQENPYVVVGFPNNGDSYIAFRLLKGSSTQYAYVDDVTLDIKPRFVTDFAATDITANSVTLTWNDADADNTTTYTIGYGETTVNNVTGTSCTVTGLDANTNYTFSIAPNAPSAETTTLHAVTLQVPATLPYATGFETTDDNAMWTVANGTNGWAFGTAANNGSEQGLYISNDNGASNAYTNSSMSWSYAYRLINFSEAGWYQISFDWKANGESTWDYLRAWLAPAAVAPHAGASPTGTTSANGYTTTNPEGWIDLAPGKMNLQTTWQSLESVNEITTAGTYTLVLMWVNDNSGGTQPPAAVDNIDIRTKSFAPDTLTAEIVNGNAVLAWSGDARNAGNETYTLLNGNEVIATGITTTNRTVALTANTDYNFNLVAVLNGENSDATSINLGLYEFPTQPGKMVSLAGTILDTIGLDATVTTYRGLGSNLTLVNTYTEEAELTAANTAYTASNEWPVYGPMTVTFVGVDATAANTGVAGLTATVDCPASITDTDPVVETINTGAYTWTTPENHVYNYGPLAGTSLDEQVAALVGSYNDTVKNAGNCDSIYRHLNLTLYPTYEVTLTDEFCEGSTYTVDKEKVTVATGNQSYDYTASAQEDVHMTAEGGADVLVHVNLHMNAAPVALINNNVNNTINNYCEGFDLNLTASAVEGASAVANATYLWEDATTAATRTVNPLSTTTNIYSLTATDPVTGCVSLEPAKLTVTTRQVPVLTVVASSEAICIGQGSTTLTVSDENEIEGVNFRWYNANTSAVVGTGASITVAPTVTTSYYVVAEGTCEVSTIDNPITITVNELPVFTVSAPTTALCAGDELTVSATEGFAQYSWNNGAATTASWTFAAATTGDYTVKVTDANGCWSEMTTASVTINPSYKGEQAINADLSVCFTQNPYTWEAMTITENGNYEQMLQTVNTQCDSLVKLHFTFEEMSVFNTQREICQKSNVTWGPTTYENIMEGTTLTYDLVAGDVDPNTSEILDCPARYNLILTVNPVRASSFDQVACDSYTWNRSGLTYTASTVDSVILATTKGCDSTVTMNLTVNYGSRRVVEETACDRFEWDLNNNVYTATTNEPVAVLANANAVGCNDTVELRLIVNNTKIEDVFYRECEHTTFKWEDGNNVTYSRNVNPEDNITWNLTAADPTVTTVEGCDTIIRLSLTMNYVLDSLNWENVASCDSWFIDTVACDGTIGRKYFDESDDSVIVRTRNAATGRDQISRIHLTINRSEHQTVVKTECVPYAWVVNDDITIDSIMESSVISQELETEAGCPLVKVLRFTAKFPTENITEVTRCQNDSWTDGNNVVYSMSNYELGENEPVQWNITTNEAGCDSTDYVVFTVNPVYVDTSNLTYCETDFTNGTLTYANPNDTTQTATLTIPTEGLNQEVYTNTVTALWSTKAGCDSTVTINYTVNPTIVEDTAIQSCYSYTWEDGNGETYTVSGDYTWDTVNEAGCMRIVTMHLTISDTISDTLLLQACGEYEYPEGSGILYREDKTFAVDTVEALSGCAQINYVSYHVTPRVIKDVYVVANAPYTWDNGVTYNNAVNGVYYDATEPGSCDSILVLHLTMEQSITLCENSLPYTTTYGVTLPDENPVFSTDFENGLEGMDNTGWSTVSDVASLTHDGGMFAMTSKTTAPTNTLVMPAVKVSAGSELTFDAAGLHQSVTAPEPTNMVVKVSTDGVNYDVLDEEELTSRVWESFTISLEQYAGQTIYLAFERLDGSDVAMCIDNVTVTGKVDNVLTEEIDDTLFVINYTVNYNTSEIVTVEACDSYTWTTGNGETYTESDMVTFDTVNVNGCDSTVILDLTVNYHSDSVLTIANCDSYTWSGIEFTESIDTTKVGLTNEVGCDSTATLHLTINVNAGTADTVVACDSYKWQWAEDTIFLSGNYSADYTDLNECQGVHTLNLTVNVSTENDLDTIVNASSTYYNGTYYADINDANEGQPYEFDVLMQGANAKGCDSVDHVTLYVTRGEVIDENYNICGNFTWERNGHTYTWIDAAERAANGNALYKDTTDNVYIHSGENPIAVVTNAMGVPTNTYVLWLNMVEANYMTIDLGTILLSQHQSTYTVGNDTLDTRTLDLSEYYAAKQNVPDYSDTIHHTSTYYCENVVTYTANLVWNYDTLDTVYVCNGVNTYDWTIGNDTFNETLTGDTTTFTETFAEGTANEMVNTITVVRNAAIVVVDTTAVACDEFTWYDSTYNASGIYTHNFEVEHNGILCDSLVTLTLTINSSNTGDTTAVVCDSLNWYEHTNITASVDTLTHVFTNANAVGCDSTVTLHLTINTNAGSTLDRVACDEFVWSVNDSVYDEGSSSWVIGTPITNTYTGAEASGTKTVQYHDANGCVGTATLNLIINHNAGIDDTVATCLTYTWTVQNRNDINGQMEDITNIYTGSADSGVKTLQFNDVNGCEGTATLNLTIYDTVNTASEDTVYGSGYTFHGHFYTPALNGGDSTYVIIYDTVDAHNCAIKDTLTLHVSQYVYTYINKAECGSYTWTAAEHGNGHTYRVLTAEEAEANPTAAFFDVTANAAVANMQQNTENGNIYVLNLTLNTPVVTVIDTVNVPMSQLAADSTYTIVTSDTTRVINCAAAVKAGQTMVITQDFSMNAEHRGPFTACDSIVRYNINVIYNYITDDSVTLCAATTYEVVAGDVRNVSTGDTTFTYILNAGQVNEEVHSVVVTNNAYTGNPVAQTVTECDSYTWTAGNGQNYTISGTYTWNDTANCVVDTLKLTINSSDATTDPHIACDTYTWVNGTTYTASNNTDTVMLTNEAGCDSVVTLNLTINYSNTGIDTLVACDSALWNGTWYYASNTTDTAMRTNIAGCDSVVTLNLTINHSNTGIDTLVACDSALWNGTWYYASNTTDTAMRTNVAGCDSVVTLNLTINNPETKDTAFWFGEGSYRYTGIFTSATGRMYMPGDYTGITEIVPNVTANSCDSIYNITLHVGNYQTMTEAKRSCNSYTWERNGVTYVRLTDAESEANPTALYKTQAGVMVYANPTDTVEVANNYDSIYMLDLTLDATAERDTVINFPISLGVLTYAGQTYDFSVAEDAAREYENTVFNDTIHIAAVQYCDSIINLTVNVIKNYNHVDADGDICMSETSYTWNNITISTVNDNYDVEKTWYIYDTVENADSLLTVVNWVAVVQHPYAYITERREACDSLDWNGYHFTESTTGATVVLTDQYGCDSTVTLSLTINTTTSHTDTIVECDGYEWTLANGEAVSPKYTESGIYTKTYNSYIDDNNKGCLSTDTLVLTINNSTEETVEETACDSYTWVVDDDTIGTYTESGVQVFNTFNTDGCNHVVTLNLTVNYSSTPVTLDAVEACDNYEWNGTTYTESGNYSYTYTNAAGCDSVVTLPLTIFKSNGVTVDTACDSYVWSVNDTTITESGVYTYTSPVANVCGNATYTLNLTVNKSTSSTLDTAICGANSSFTGYEWNGVVYTADANVTIDGMTNAAGCDSTATLKLTVGNFRTFGRVYVENCGPYKWDVSGETFEEVGETEASFIMENANAGGCDSVIYLYLTIYEQPVVNETKVLCDNEIAEYSWRGMSFETAGEYTDFGGAANEHCDSLYTLALTVNERTYSAVSDTACDSYEWNGTVYTESGDYNYTTSNAAGCDSVATLHLTINANSGHAVSVAVCDSFEWNNTTYTASGEYYFGYEDGNNCASVDTLQLVIANSEDNTIEETSCDNYTWVVNEDTIGTYTESGIYQHNYTTTDGCDGILNLNLTVNYSNSGEENAEACDTYEWNEETYTETGVYTFQTTNVAGCDSIVTLNLTIKASTESEENATACNFYTWNNTTYTESGDYTYNTQNAAGCDSTATLHLTVNSSDAVTLSDTACDSYSWNGANYTQSGAYTYATTNVAGCDSIVTLNLTVNYSTAATVEAAACDTYEWTEGNGQTYTESGNYNYTTTAANGCDSVVTLALTINNSNSETIEMAACDSYEWNGELYNQSGQYTYQTTNVAGCDSVVTLNLTINTATAGTEDTTVCDSYAWNGETYEQSGVYTYTTTNAAGCDSVVTLTLTVNYSTTETLDTAVCGSFTWTDGDGETYSTTGIRTFDTTNVEGCNLVKTLFLTINQPITTTVHQTVCDSYEWNNETYNATGNYTYTTTAANGCDSIVTLALTVNNSTVGSVTDTACDSYSWNGTIYTESNTYTYNTTNVAGCDSTVTLNLTINNSSSSDTIVASCGSYTWNNVVYSQSGNYSYTTTNAVGCDSVANLFLTVNHGTIADPITVEACLSYTWNGNVYTQSGVYYDTTANNQGCDNVAALILTIKQPYTTTVHQTACDSYEWNNVTYTVSGNYVDTLTAGNSCDSIVTLALTVNESKTGSFEASVCNEQFYTWNGQNYNAAGPYTQVLTARNGCDSTVTMNLTVLQPINVVDTQTACVSFTWGVNNANYTASGDYTANIIDANNCAATASLNLTVNQPINSTIDTTVCVSCTWNGTEYTETGAYTRDITDANGCAAIETLNLTINVDVPDVLTVTACDSYTWVVNDEIIGTYTETPGYQLGTTTTGENGCPHAVYLMLTVNHSDTTVTDVTAVGSYEWHGTEYTESGTYTFIGTTFGGCDSVMILNLTVNPPINYFDVTLTSSNVAMGSVSTINGTDTVMVEGTMSIAENSIVNAIAISNPGYKFVGWTEGDDIVSTDSIYSFIVTSDVNLVANFEYIPIYYTVSTQVVTVMHDGNIDTVYGQHGQVIGEGEYESGSTVTLTAVADSGFHFVCWSNGRNTATITFTVTDDINLIAYFEQDALPEAIDETDMSDVTIFSVDTKIIVRGAEGYDVYVFDVNGRTISRQLNAADEVEFRMASTGVYLVKVGNAPAKRVLVVR